jgi:hypothetical protein
MARKDVRVYFNDLATQKHFRTKSTSFHKRYSSYQMSTTDNDSIDGDEEEESSFQCTAL